MKQDELERRMLSAARDYNEPPEPPREEMWAVVRKAIPAGDEETGSLDLDARRRARRTRDRLRSWSPWVVGLAAAAALAVGFGLGRITGDGVVASGPEAVATGEAPGRSAPSTPAGGSLPVRVAAASHISEAEAMLTLFRSSDRPDDRAATARWARDLLSTTRLLMDSRVAEDPELSELLSDLELVLVQIVGATGEVDEELIEEGIRERQLLTKLRTAAAEPTAMAM
jgi:hypothetical protein